jgi:L-threonylcarbamoyladenylate synthase
VSRVYDCREADGRTDGVAAAAAALARGGLVVLPTDTVYGVGGDAFDPGAVAALLAAKGRGRDMPPPVLVAGPDVLPALTSDLTPEVTALTERFWPGPLTLICWAQPSLQWDLGDTGGTVAVRVPDHDLARQLLRATGPLAVSSANLTGQQPGATAELVREQLADSVQVYLEVGELGGSAPSSIVDATGEVPRLVRAGALSLAQLREVVPDLVDGTVPVEPVEEPEPADEPADEPVDEPVDDAGAPTSGS